MGIKAVLASHRRSLVRPSPPLTIFEPWTLLVLLILVLRTSPSEARLQSLTVPSPMNSAVLSSRQALKNESFPFQDCTTVHFKGFEHTVYPVNISAKKPQRQQIIEREREEREFFF